MQSITTITPKFQVHIPVEIRRKLNITTHGKANISVEKGKIIIEPIESKFMSLGGKYRTPKAMKVETLRNEIDYSA